MDKVWFIQIEGKKEGPFTIAQLKRNREVTPDTLVWKKGFTEWVAARFVPELADLFKDEEENKPAEEEVKPIGASVMQDQVVLTIQQDPSQMFLWILIFILVLIYAIYQFQ